MASRRSCMFAKSFLQLHRAPAKGPSLPEGGTICSKSAACPSGGRREELPFRPGGHTGLINLEAAATG